MVAACWKTTAEPHETVCRWSYNLCLGLYRRNIDWGVLWVWRMQASAVRITTLRIHKKVCYRMRWGGEGAGSSSWLRHCATSRKVAGSIPDGVIEIFHLHNPSGVTMVQIYFLEGTGGQCVGLTILSSSCASEAQPPGSLRAWTGIALPYRIRCAETQICSSVLSTVVK
jgi:hypothetical protein